MLAQGKGKRSRPGGHVENFEAASIRESTSLLMTASAPISIAPSSTGGPLRLRAGFVDINSPPAKLGTVKSCNCLFPLIGVGHLDKRESARTACLTVGQNTYAVNLPIRLKGLA